MNITEIKVSCACSLPRHKLLRGGKKTKEKNKNVSFKTRDIITLKKDHMKSVFAFRNRIKRWRNTEPVGLALCVNTNIALQTNLCLLPLN